MNTNILQKCVEELKKESPRLDYVLGMLETLIEGNFTINQPIQTVYPSQPYPLTQPFTIPTGPYAVNGGASVILSDEEKLAQAYAGGPVGHVGTV